MVPACLLALTLTNGLRVALGARRALANWPHPGGPRQRCGDANGRAEASPLCPRLARSWGPTRSLRKSPLHWRPSVKPQAVAGRVQDPRTALPTPSSARARTAALTDRPQCIVVGPRSLVRSPARPSDSPREDLSHGGLRLSCSTSQALRRAPTAGWKGRGMDGRREGPTDRGSEGQTDSRTDGQTEEERDGLQDRLADG